MASLRRRQPSPHRRSNAILVRAVDSREGVTETIALGPIILKNHQIRRQQTPITAAPMSPSRRSISRSGKPLRAVAKPARRFKPNRNSVRASLKSPAKGLGFCAIRNAILSRRHRISLLPRKLCAASLCAMECGSTARSDAVAVVRN